MEKKAFSSPWFWGSLILAVSQALTLGLAVQEKRYLEENQIALPEASLGFTVVYFFAAVVLLGGVLFFIPVSKLRIVVRVLFALLFAWGVFIDLVFFLPMEPVAGVALVAGLFWFFSPRVWLHNLLLILTLASWGAVFGAVLPPWTAIAFMTVVSIYDVLAVRLGYMLWMAKKLSQTTALPAFAIPGRPGLWRANLNKVSLDAPDEKSGDREFSILGGGDIGFPLMLAVSTFFIYGMPSAVTVALFSIVGLAGAYWFQRVFLKGKPMPALPPITIGSVLGFLVALIF